MSLLHKITILAVVTIVSNLGASALANQPVAPQIQPIPRTTATFPSVQNSAITLRCGTTYYGYLHVANTTNLTIKTERDDCERAVITPARPVTGWQRYSGNIYMAYVSYEVSQALVNGQLMRHAHYPNSWRESGWIQPTGKTDTTVTVSSLPNRDVIGAKIISRGDYPWAIGTRIVTAFDGQKLTVAFPTFPKRNPADTSEVAKVDIDLKLEDSINLGRFYLEGKLWMLDSAGEWAWSNGKLYVWMPDGQAPGDRVMAAPNLMNTRDGQNNLVNKRGAVINAQGATNLTVKSVRIVGGRVGIDGGYNDQTGRASLRLQITNTEIAHSDWVGFYASEAKNFAFDGSQIIGALHTGIYARTGTSESVIRNSRFVNVNYVGMRKGSDGTIYLNADSYARVENNTLIDSGKSAIFIGESKNSLVKRNTINGACRIHGDCGGIYLFSRPRDAHTAPLPLYTRVEGNHVKNVTGDPVRPGSTNPERYGIYLDDYANKATIIANTVEYADTGMQLHFAFDNDIISNAFKYSAQRHILLSDDKSSTEGGRMRDNDFDNNIYYGSSLVYLLAVLNPSTAATFGLTSPNNYNHVQYSALVSPSSVTVR